MREGIPSVKHSLALKKGIASTAAVRLAREMFFFKVALRPQHGSVVYFIQSFQRFSMKFLPFRPSLGSIDAHGYKRFMVVTSQLCTSSSNCSMASVTSSIPHTSSSTTHDRTIFLTPKATGTRLHASPHTHPFTGTCWIFLNSAMRSASASQGLTSTTICDLSTFFFLSFSALAAFSASARDTLGLSSSSSSSKRSSISSSPPFAGFLAALPLGAAAGAAAPGVPTSAAMWMNHLRMRVGVLGRIGGNSACGVHGAISLTEAVPEVRLGAHESIESSQAFWGGEIKLGSHGGSLEAGNGV
ncbi:unnamed protein product, partial [Chrysoparadoxa australica]